MGYNLTFTDNQEVTANLLNAIQQELGNNVNASTDFTDGVLYAVDKLNQIREDIVTAGVAKGCGCILVNGKIKIQSGVCFFSNGLRIEVDANGVELDLAEGKNYVYFYRSGANGVALPIISPEEKTGTANNEYIPLVEVENGIVTDKRAWCKSKIPLAAGNYVYSQTTTTPAMHVGYGRTKVADVALQDNTYTFVRSKFSSSTDNQNNPIYKLGITTFDADPPTQTGNFAIFSPDVNPVSFVFIKNGKTLEVWVESFRAGYDLRSFPIEFLIA